VVGWKLDQRLDATLANEAPNRALGHRRVGPDKLLIHMDQGSQYRATDYRDLLAKHEIVCSMFARGCCWDNAVVESFFSTLKLELDLDDDRDVLISSQQLHRDLAFWIEDCYNCEPRHSLWVAILRAAGSLFVEMGVRPGGAFGASATWLFPGFVLG
jgi:putative transposase